MATINLIHKRVGNDIQMAVQVLDNGTAISWSEVSDINARLFSDSQRVRLGMCSVDGALPDDETTMMLTYSGDLPQYLGVARLVLNFMYHNHSCSLDAPVIYFVASTAEEGIGPVEVYIPAEVDPEFNNLEIVVGKGSTASWGTISGSLSNQADLKNALDGKQDVIPDLPAIRSGATAGSTAYRKPVGGIPSTDMSSAVQQSLIKADSGYQRPYDTVSPSGLGFLVLDKNRSFASQVTEENTIYEIRYDYDLDGNSVTIPEGCTLRFIGGSISNGDVILNGTRLEGDVKLYCSMSGTMSNPTLYSSWNNDVPLSVDNAKALGKPLYIDKEATLTAPLSLFGMRDVTIRSTITNSETNYIEIGYSSSTSLPVNIDIWNASYVKMTGGKEVMATIRHCDNFMLEVDSAVSGKGSIAYCTFHLGFIRNFSIIGHNNGWINENTFIKGRFIDTLTIQGDGYVHNHNVFYNPSLEGNLVISLDKCAYNTFHDCRMEGSPTMNYGATATNNRFYRSWLDSPASLWRMYYGARSKNNNGVYFDESTFVKSFTIDRNSYINGRDLSKVSLCDDSLSVRHEVSGTYATLKITPKSNFGVIMNSDNAAMSRMRVYLFDQDGVNITDTVTTYIDGITSFTKETGVTYTYYQLARDDNYAFLEVRVDSINQILLTEYGVDSNDIPVKQIGYVNVSFYPDNVRKTFNYVDLRVVFPAKARDNAGVDLILPFATVTNVSSSVPTIKSTISGNAVPYSLLEGETCLVTGKNALYTRVGSSILFVGGVGARGEDRPTLSSGETGYMFFDQTLGKYVVWNGSDWVNVDGTSL